jgi:hypothetical protein
MKNLSDHAERFFTFFLAVLKNIVDFLTLLIGTESKCLEWKSTAQLNTAFPLKWAEKNQFLIKLPKT